MTPLASKALDLAAAEIGVHEMPPGSNRGRRVEDYLGAVNLPGGNPWCAAFVCYVVREAGRMLEVKPALRPSGSVLQLLRRNPELLLDRPEEGSVFIHLLPDGHGHTGFVLGVNDDLSFADISGNSDASGSRTGGMVCQNRRPPGYAMAFLAVR